MRKWILSAVLVLLIGCQEPAPMPRWKVTLIRPDGQRQEAWYVSSRTKPVPVSEWGGQVQLTKGPGYTKTGLFAPAGWYFDIKRAE